MKPKDWRPTAFVETTPGLVGDGEADARRIAQRTATAALHRLLLGLDVIALGAVVAMADRLAGASALRHAGAVAAASFLIGLVVSGVASLALLGDGPRAGSRREAGGRGGFEATATALAVLALVVGMGAMAAPYLASALR